MFYDSTKKYLAIFETNNGCDTVNSYKGIVKYKPENIYDSINGWLEIISPTTGELLKFTLESN